MIGFKGALIEISLFLFISNDLYDKIGIKNIDFISYLWILFTILTGLWELVYILNHNKSIKISNNLIKTNKHVWFNNYKLNMLLPWNFSLIFYGEYGAYADREYMTNKDIWSRVIEGSHLLFCGIISYIAIILNIINYKYDILLGTAMGAQSMNSILYMFEYYNQTKDINSINYNCNSFPLGTLWCKRPFMYINILWTIMPLYVIYSTM